TMLTVVACSDDDDEANNGSDNVSNTSADCADTGMVTDEPDTEMNTPAVEGAFEAITVITFDDTGTLYVGDSGTGQIHALTPPAGENPSAGQPYNLQNIDTTLAELIGTTPNQIRVRDLAVHPATTEAYIAVAWPNGDTMQSTIAVMNQTGTARLLETEATEAVMLPFAPTDDFLFYDDFPSRDLSITDLTVHGGMLYIAGMSNADFASTLWTIPVPFGQNEPSVTTVEIYHGVHGQLETRAPIRTMTISQIDGEPMVLAAYTCTPLVAFPVADLQDGAHIVGQTIGELGYGNTPGDMISFDVQSMEGDVTTMLFIQNKNQSAQVIPMPVIAGAVAQPGIEEPLGFEKVDLGAFETPMTGILQIEDQDPGRLLSIRRDAEAGDLEMVSYLKNVYFRLSDFQSEYEVPNYVYPPDQEGIKQFQNMMKIDEGHPDTVVD
ncbi:MAG: hypothetical protein AAFS10_20550, partial [Myxococcota bacterium]